MTALALSFWPDKLTVAADTLTSEGGSGGWRASGEIHKVLPFHNPECALIVVGFLLIRDHVAQAIMAMEFDPSLDKLADLMTAMVQNACEAYAAEASIADCRSYDFGNLYLAGYCLEQKRMRIWEYGPAAGYAASEFPAPPFVLPIPSLAPTFAPRITGRPNDRQLAEIVLAGGRQYDADGRRNGRCGGKILAWDCTADGWNKPREIGRFPDYDATLVEIADSVTVT